MTFDLLVEEWCKEIEALLTERDVPTHDARGTIPLPERVTMALNAATAVEQERCITAINKALDELGQFECAEMDIGSWDVRRYCIAAIGGGEIAKPKRCDAVIYHGPGHQSETKCCLVGPHDIHETRYGSHDHLARWKGDKVFSGYFDEAPDIGEGNDE